jgi:flagellar biosynthesis/type III secretory pathway ATPase
MSDIAPEVVTRLAAEVRDILATYQETEDLITIGAYKPGQNKRVDRAVALIDKVTAFLRQRSVERTGLEEGWQYISQLLRAPIAIEGQSPGEPATRA